MIRIAQLRPVSMLGLFMLLSIVLYGNTISGEFVYDDIRFVSSREDLRDPRMLLTAWIQPYHPDRTGDANYRPFANASMTGNFVLFGDAPTSFHVVSILLNGIATYLVYLLLIAVTKKKHLAFISTVLYAALPVHTEAVAMIKARDELFVTIFVLGSWIAYLRATQRTRTHSTWLWISVGLFFLALMSKELLFMAPLVFGIVRYIQTSASARRVISSLVPFGGAYALYAVFRAIALGEQAFVAGDASQFVKNPLAFADPWSRLLTSFSLYAHAVERILVPIRLSATYWYNHIPVVTALSSSLSAIVGILLVLGSIFLIVHPRLRRTPLGIGAVIFLLPSVVINKFVLSGFGELFVERWLYFPSLGLALMLGYGFVMLIQRQKRWGSIGLALVLILLAGRTIHRNYVWRSNDALFDSMIQSAPHSVQGYHGRAIEYAMDEQYDDAIPHMQQALTIYADDIEIIGNYGRMLIGAQRYEEAESTLLYGLQVSPDDREILIDLSRVYILEERPKEVLALLESYISLPQIDPEVGLLYATALTQVGEYDESTALLEHVYPPDLQDDRVQYLLDVNARMRAAQ